VYAVRRENHGKTESGYRHIKGRQSHGHTLILIENIYNGKAHRCKQESVYGMQHRIPVGYQYIVFLDLSQNICRENKHQNDDFQSIRQINMEPFFDHTGQDKQHQRQQADKNIFIVPVMQLQYQRQQNQCPKHNIHRKNFSLVGKVFPGGPLCPGFSFFFLSHGKAPL